MAERKVMIGPRVRRMRLERGLTQKQMAEELGISTSYLNLIERNQRPVTVQLLLKLGQSYDIDLQRFAVDDEARVAALLKETFGDPLFARSGVTNQDIQDMAAASPVGGEAVFALFRSYRELVDNALNLAEGLSDTDKLGEVAALRLLSQHSQQRWGVVLLAWRSVEDNKSMSCGDVVSGNDLIIVTLARLDVGDFPSWLCE